MEWGWRILAAGRAVWLEFGPERWDKWEFAVGYLPRAGAQQIPPFGRNDTAARAE